MNNPFRVGDKVYVHHHTAPQIVSGVDPHGLVLTRDLSGWYPIHMVSFDPWPEPNHTRKIEVGYWVVRPEPRVFRGRTAVPVLQVMHWNGEVWRHIRASGAPISTAHNTEFDPMKFIGAEL